MLVEVTCALDVCSHTINQTPLLMSHTHTLLWLFFFFLITFRPGFRRPFNPDEKDDPDARRERSAAVSKRQLALASAPDQAAAAADEMRSRYRTHASGRGGPALAFWQGTVGGPRFFMFTLRFRKLKHEINVDA